MTIAPNTFFGGRLEAVPGSGTVSLSSGLELDREQAEGLADALIDAQSVASMPLERHGRTLHSITAQVLRAELTRDRNRSVLLKLDLEVGPYRTAMSIPGSDFAAQELMALLDVWSLSEINGQSIEVLYTNEPAGIFEEHSDEFLISNGSMPRALRNLDVDPSIVISAATD